MSTRPLDSVFNAPDSMRPDASIMAVGNHRSDDEGGRRVMEHTSSSTLKEEVIETAAEPSGDLWAIPAPVHMRTIGAAGDSPSQGFP